MSIDVSEFSHAKERRSLSHRYADLEKEVRPLAEAAYRNEQLTRERLRQLEVLMDRQFLGRLKWLLTGR